MNPSDPEPAKRRGHRPPGPEESQPLRPRNHVPRTDAQRSQAGGGTGLVNVEGRLYVPLQGINPANILMGGYGWLSYTDGGATHHPGLDLNSGNGCNDDEGALVVAPLAGVVRHVLYAASGEGNHVWVEIDDVCSPGPTWMHVDHLQTVQCQVGQRLVPGQVFGTCGRSGGWDCAHLHLETCKGAPSTGPWQWPYGWSRAEVEAEYYDPSAWWNAATGLVYAAGSQPIPPEVVEAMSDWELTNYVLAQLYEWAGIPFNADGGIQRCWVGAAVRDGHYPGRPRTDDRQYGAPGKGWWAEFDHAVLIYNEDGTMSWKG